MPADIERHTTAPHRLELGVYKQQVQRHQVVRVWIDFRNALDLARYPGPKTENHLARGQVEPVAASDANRICELLRSYEEVDVHGGARVTVQSEGKAAAQGVLDTFTVERVYKRLQLGNEVQCHGARILAGPVRTTSLESRPLSTVRIGIKPPARYLLTPLGIRQTKRHVRATGGQRYAGLMSSGSVAAVMLFVTVLSACFECDLPETTTYSCQPVAASSSGCQGGPMWQPKASDAGPPRQDDPGLTFPIGCSAEIPDCSGPQGSSRTFECITGSGQGLWIELL